MPSPRRITETTNVRAPASSMAATKVCNAAVSLVTALSNSRPSRWDNIVIQMVSNGPAKQHKISWTRLIGGEPYSGRDEPDSRGVYKQSIAASFFMTFGASGDHNDACQSSCETNGFHHPA